MKRTLIALLLVVGLIFCFSPAWADDFNLDSVDESVEALGDAGGSAFNESNTHGSQTMIDVYIEKITFSSTPVFNDQLDMKIETIKTVNINKTDTTTVDVDVDVDKTDTTTVQGGEPEAVTQSFGESNGNGGSHDGDLSMMFTSVDVDWFPMCCPAIDLLVENVQIALMSQKGGQHSDMGVDDAFAEGEGTFEMRGQNIQQIGQQLEASNGMVGQQLMQSSSTIEVLINGGGAVTTTDTFSIDHTTTVEGVF